MFGLCLGAACHVLLDLTYLQPFSPLWPYVGRTWGPFFGPTKSEVRGAETVQEKRAAHGQRRHQSGA